MTDREELIARLEALSGPDRVVDIDLALHFAGKTKLRVREVLVVDRVARWVDEWDGRRWREAELPALTASIDAALALVERERPGWVWNLSDGDNHGPFAFVHKPDNKNPVGSMAANPTIALLIALLRSEPDK